MAKYHEFIQIDGHAAEKLDIITQQAEYSIAVIHNQTDDPEVIARTYLMWLSRFVEEIKPIVKNARIGG